MAQTAHATAAVLHETAGRPETVAYLVDLLQMRKVRLRLDAFNLNDLNVYGRL